MVFHLSPLPGESSQPFSIFLLVEEGIEGLIHNSQLGTEKGDDVAAAYPLGGPIECEVTNVDREERRISLSMKAIKRRKDKEVMADYMEDVGTAITFGDLLRKKMDSGES